MLTATEKVTIVIQTEDGEETMCFNAKQINWVRLSHRFPNHEVLFFTNRQGKPVIVSQDGVMGDILSPLTFQPALVQPSNSGLPTKILTKAMIGTAAQLCRAAYVDVPENTLAELGQHMPLDELWYSPQNETRYVCGLNKENMIAFIAFRGTTSAEDHLRNLNIYAKGFDGHTDHLRCHGGFLDSLSSTPVYSFTKRLLAEGYDLILCGHSAGGAMATILNFVLHCDFLQRNVKLERRIRSVAFGAPFSLTSSVEAVVRDKGWSDHFVVIVNEKDWIPNVTVAVRDLRNSSDFLGLIPGYEMVTDVTHRSIQSILDRVAAAITNSLSKYLDQYSPVGNYYFLSRSQVKHLTDAKDVIEHFKTFPISKDGLGHHAFRNYELSLSSFLDKRDKLHGTVKSAKNFQPQIESVLGQYTVVESRTKLVMKLIGTNLEFLPKKLDLGFGVYLNVSLSSSSASFETGDVMYVSELDKKLDLNALTSARIRIPARNINEKAEFLQVKWTEIPDSISDFSVTKSADVLQFLLVALSNFKILQMNSHNCSETYEQIRKALFELHGHLSMTAELETVMDEVDKFPERKNMTTFSVEISRIRCCYPLYYNTFSRSHLVNKIFFWG
jgi:hypothetical protein